MDDLHVIAGPEDDYRGPATGIGTEHGDSWKAAVDKINANFQRVLAATESGGLDVAKLVERIAAAVRRDMEAALDAAHKRIDELERRMMDAASVPPIVPPIVSVDPAKPGTDETVVDLDAETETS